jgi:endonuclease/exonuclease/phosphatase family metal-dependent hydrolase
MRVALLTASVIAIVAAVTVPRAQVLGVNDSRIVRVMTRNVYHGVNAEIFAVPTAASLPDLMTKVAAVYHGYVARNFADRAAVLAAEVEATRPDLIGLQEAVLVRTDARLDGAASPATTVAFDYVQILLAALAARGLSYEIVTQLAGMDVELPSALGFDVRHTDREVILARSDLTTADLKLSNVQTGHFAVNCSIPTPFGAVLIRRGWAAVDAKVRGKSFRFITTHLDGDCLAVTSAIQQAQAAEVVAGPATTHLPLVFVGDLNSPADGSGATYNTLTGDGFSDVWTTAGTGSGLTCCHASDLLNEQSTLNRRIDLILTRGDVEVRHVAILGDNAALKTPSGSWPSDHAGVVAELALPPR